jgi:hypothetical protein
MIQEKIRFANSLRQQGLSEDEILVKLREFDKAGKLNGATNVGANEAPNNQAPKEDSVFRLEPGLSDFQKDSALYEHNYKEYINSGKDAKFVNLFVKAPEISTFERAEYLDSEGKGVRKETNFFKDFKKNINDDLSNNFFTIKDEDGNIIDFKSNNNVKTTKTWHSGVEQKREDATDEQIYNVVNKTIQDKYISNDPVIKRKQEEFNVTLKPQIEKIQQEVLSKYQGKFGTSTSLNESLYNQYIDEVKEKVGKLSNDFYKDPEVQSRLQQYQRVQDDYFNTLNRKIKRQRSDLFKLYDNTSYLGDFLEGVDIGVTGIMQGFRGIGLQEEEKDLTNAQSRLNKLKEQLDKNPESGDEEQEYVTGEVE